MQYCIPMSHKESYYWDLATKTHYRKLKLCKKLMAIRAITNRGYNANTNELFKVLQHVLKLISIISI